MSVGHMAKPMNTRNLETRAALPHTEGQWESELKCIQPTKQNLPIGKEEPKVGRPVPGERVQIFGHGAQANAQMSDCRATPSCRLTAQVTLDWPLDCPPLTGLQLLLCHRHFTGISFLFCKMMCLFQAS